MTIDSKTLGPVSDYRATKTVRSYAALAKVPSWKSTFAILLLLLAFIVLPVFLGGQPISSACNQFFTS